MGAEKVIRQIETVFLYVLIILLPIIVLPVFANAFTTAKILVLTFGLGIILLIKAIRMFMKGSVEISMSAFDFPVLVLAIVYIVSSIWQTPNKMEAFFLPGTATIIVAVSLLYFVVNQLSNGEKKAFKSVLFTSGAVFAFVSLLAVAGVFGALPVPEFMKANSFNTLGGSLPGIILLVSLLPMGIGAIINEKEMAKKAFFGVATTVIVLAGLATGLNALPAKASSPQLPTFTTSWGIAIDSLKDDPLLGVGPGNYLSAFNRFRPLSYNQTDLWAIRFTSGRNFVFTTVTETGLLGLASLTILGITLVKTLKGNTKKHDDEEESIASKTSVVGSVIVLTIALLLFPATPTLLAFFFVMVALINKTHKVKFAIPATEDSSNLLPKLPSFVAGTLLGIGVIAYGYFAIRILTADITFKRALDRIAANDGRGAYDTLREAIDQNPYVDRYRVSYAQVNLALANSVAGNENISEQDQQTIAQLVQQAIREGKVAVALNPARAGNWEVLASIYRAVIPLAEGADAFAVQSYNQAVALDPINPNTRIALGGIYYGIGAYQDAIDIFRLAALAKPDHANARYNLGVAYREAGETERAINEMSVVLTLVDRDSEDYKVAAKALEELQTKAAEAAKQQESGETLTPPSTIEDAPEGSQIELPEDAQPPEPEVAPEVEGDSTEANPSPSASPSPTASASPTPQP